jgi:selenium metabolism protein YedF
VKKTIDCRGLACPRPVILTKKELEAADIKGTVSIVDNDTAKQNLQKLAESLGYKSELEEKDGLFYVTIMKQCEGITPADDTKELVILVGSNKLGAGDERLGIALMKSYIYALSESSALPKSMLFVNSGVMLTTEGSEVMDSLRVLEQKGVEILSCGTCLDFYNLKETWQIGTVTNMYTIVEKTNKANNTIKL